MATNGLLLPDIQARAPFIGGAPEFTPVRHVRLGGIVMIKSGGGVVEDFAEDACFEGGSVSGPQEGPVDTEGVRGGAPAEAYLSHRYGRFSYCIPGRTPRATYLVRLHFAETVFSEPGARVFDIALNGRKVLRNFDVLAAGGPRRAVVREFAAIADDRGAITVDFIPGPADNPMLCAIEVHPRGDSTLHDPWMHGDVGRVPLPGSAVYLDGSFLVGGCGADIWGRSDQFHWMYQPFHDESEVIVRISSLEAAHPWAKAGLMIRAGLSPGSAFAALFLTPGGTAAFQFRAETGKLAEHRGLAGWVTPAWLKLVRRGDRIRGRVSKDGVTWTEVGSASLALPEVAMVGLAVCSHDDTVCRARFENFSLAAPGYREPINSELAPSLEL